MLEATALMIGFMELLLMNLILKKLILVYLIFNGIECLLEDSRIDIIPVYILQFLIRLD